MTSGTPTNRTTVVRVPERGSYDRAVAESSAKTRSGPPNDDEADKAWPVWAGVIPLRVEALAPVPAEDVSVSLAGFDVIRLKRR